MASYNGSPETGALFEVLTLIAPAAGAAVIVWIAIAAFVNKRTAEWLKHTIVWLVLIPLIFLVVVVVSLFLGSRVRMPNGTVNFAIGGIVFAAGVAIAVPIIAIVAVVATFRRGAAAIGYALAALLVYVTAFSVTEVIFTNRYREMQIRGYHGTKRKPTWSIALNGTRSRVPPPA